MAEEIIKKSFGLNKANYSFNRQEKQIKVDTSFDEVQRNPINKILNDFQEKYDEHERDSSMFFDEVAELQEELDNFLRIEEYHEMDIVKLFKMLLNSYDRWAYSMNKNSVLAMEKMKQVQQIVEDKYKSITSYEEIEKKYQEAIKKIDYYEKALVRWNVKYVTSVPQKLRDALSKQREEYLKKQESKEGAKE